MLKKLKIGRIDLIFALIVFAINAIMWVNQFGFTVSNALIGVTIAGIPVYIGVFLEGLFSELGKKSAAVIVFGLLQVPFYFLPIAKWMVGNWGVYGLLPILIWLGISGFLAWWAHEKCSLLTAITLIGLVWSIGFGWLVYIR